MHLNWGFVKFQFLTWFGEKIKITQIHPRSVLNLQIDLKIGMIWIWTWDFYKSNWEVDLDKKLKYPKCNQDLFWNLQLI